MNDDNGRYRLGLMRRLINVLMRIGVWPALTPTVLLADGARS
jgi:hypothetical protein